MSMISSTRRSFLAGAGAAALVASTPARSQTAGEASIAALWQRLELQDRDDNAFYIKDSRKKLTIVKMWANWCPVCLHEIAKLDSLVAAVGPQNLDLILVSYPTWFEEDVQAAKSRGVPYRLATPTQGNGRARIQAALTDANGLYSVPRSLIFRQAGEEVVLAHQGAMDWTDEATLAQLRNAVV